MPYCKIDTGGVICQIQLNILQYLAVNLGRDLGVGRALGELLPDRHKGEDCLPVHEEELPPVLPRLVLDDKLVSVVTVRVAAHQVEIYPLTVAAGVDSVPTNLDISSP